MENICSKYICSQGIACCMKRETERWRERHSTVTALDIHLQTECRPVETAQISVLHKRQEATVALHNELRDAFRAVIDGFLEKQAAAMESYYSNRPFNGHDQIQQKSFVLRERINCRFWNRESLSFLFSTQSDPAVNPIHVWRFTAWIKNKFGLNAWKCAPEPKVTMLWTPASSPARFHHDIIRGIT